jgi:hypothetical protein
MRIALVSAALLALAACSAQQQTGTFVGDVVGEACIDGAGSMEPAVCSLPGPAVAGKPPGTGVCRCPATAQKITAPYCASGERPPVETREYRAAVQAAASGDGTLVGDSFNGKPMCILPRQT